MKDAFGSNRFSSFDDAPATHAAPWSIKILLVQIGFFTLLAFSALALWLLADVTVYARQQVRLDRVGPFCFIKYGSRRNNRQVTNPTPDCEGLRQQMRQQKLSSSYRLVQDTMIAFNYVSPADGRTYIGILRRSTNDTGQTAKRGDRIVIHASRLFAVTYTDWSSPSVYK